MKKFLIVLFLIAFSIHGFSQQRDKWRGGIDLGLSFPNSGFGFLPAIDVRYNFMDNMNLGAKLGVTSMFKEFDADEESFIVQGTLFFLINGDYYFHQPNKDFSPFIGAGFGSFFIYNVFFTEDDDEADLVFDEESNKIGGIIRGGFEYGKFRLGLEYYILPKTKLYDVDGYIIDKDIKNSFFNLSIGFYFGGGKWKNSPIR